MRRRGVPLVLVLVTALAGVLLVLDGVGRSDQAGDPPSAILAADQPSRGPSIGPSSTPPSPSLSPKVGPEIGPRTGPKTGPQLGPNHPIGPTQPVPPDRFVGSPVAARPMRSPAVPANPFLASYSALGLHADSYSSNATAVRGPLGKKLEVRSQRYGHQLCSAVVFDRHDRLVGLCTGRRAYALSVIDPATLAPIDRQQVSGRLPGRPTAPSTDMCGTPSFFLDRDDRAYTAAFDPDSDPAIVETKVGDDGHLTPARTFSLADAVPSDDCLESMTLDWSGRIWFVTQHGTVGTLDRKTHRARVRRIPRDEAVFTSLSTDAQGSVYLVSTHAVYRFEPNRAGAPRVVWRVPYTRGTRIKPGQPAVGSANPPTLVGDRWLAITDNAQPRSRLVVLDRTSATAPQPTCTVPLFGRNHSAPASGMMAVGSSVVIGNNYGYTGPASTSGGRSTAPGISRVNLSASGCSTRWTSPLIAPSAIAKAAVGSGLLYTYTKPVRRDHVDAWYLTAVDLRTGERAWSRLVGTGPAWDNHGSPVHLSPDGAAYLATGAGLLQLKDRR